MSNIDKIEQMSGNFGKLQKMKTMAKRPVSNVHVLE